MFVMGNEINYGFRQRMTVVHKPNRYDPAKRPVSGQIVVTSDWCIVYPPDADKVLMNAVRDLEDYFSVSMELDLKACRKPVPDKPQIVYAIDSSLPANSYRLRVAGDRIDLLGSDSRMAAQAGYFLEDLMNLEEAPFLSPVDEVRTNLFAPRMVHSGYGLDMYPTEHLRQIAHAGISALLVFVKDVDTTPHGYQDFNDLCTRAAAWGLDVYAYSYHGNLVHPDDEAAEAFYENLYGTLFDRCPYFKGIIFVGESCEFPSKDPHTMMVRRKDNRDKNGKPILPWNKPYPGWWPCYDYAEFFELIQRVIHRHRADADVVFWSYGWDDVPLAHKKALMDRLPKGISFQSTFEVGETIMREGIANFTVDYTLFSAGPSYSFSTEARLAKENGLRLYAMTNTGGMTWDIGVVPYIPAPYQWIKRFEAMRHCNAVYGLCGTMDSHHFGIYPSFISDLAKWAFSTPYADLHSILRKLAVRDFTESTAEAVCEAYRLFSDGIYHLVSTEPDQYGPCRIGPAYPFILFDHQDVQIPTVPYAHFGGNKITFPVYGNSSYLQAFDILATEERRKKFDHEIQSFQIAEDLYARGCALLAKAVSAVPERKKEDAERILALCTFIRNTIRTAVNLKMFYLRKCRVLDRTGDDRRELIAEMLAICEQERENVLDTIPLVEFDSRLGFEPSMEYMCDAAHLQWKLNLLDEVIQKELPGLME